MVHEPSNGLFTQHGKQLNAIAESKKKNSAQKERGSARVKQHELDQNRDLSEGVLGNKSTCTEKEKREDFSSEALLSRNKEEHVKEVSFVNTCNGQLQPNEPEGVLGPKLLGPSESVTKVYVRRKEGLVSKRQAQYLKSPTVNSATGLNPVCMSLDIPEEVKRQYALVKDLGLTHGGDASKVQQVMKDMDTRDNNMAVEMGFKNQQL